MECCKTIFPCIREMEFFRFSPITNKFLSPFSLKRHIWELHNSFNHFKNATWNGYTNPFSTLQKSNCTFITKTHRLDVHREVITLRSQNCTKCLNTMWGQNAETRKQNADFVNLRYFSAYSCHWALHHQLHLSRPDVKNVYIFVSTLHALYRVVLRKLRQNLPLHIFHVFRYSFYISRLLIFVIIVTLLIKIFGLVSVDLLACSITVAALLPNQGK
jgi:hypothetical protein